MKVFYRIWKQYNKIQLPKKMDLIKQSKNEKSWTVFLAHSLFKLLYNIWRNLSENRFPGVKTKPFPASDVIESHFEF